MKTDFELIKEALEHHTLDDHESFGDIKDLLKKLDGRIDKLSVEVKATRAVFDTAGNIKKFIISTAVVIGSLGVIGAAIIKLWGLIKN